MLSFLPGPLLGSLALIILALNTIWWCSILVPLSLLKLIIPVESFRVLISRLLIRIARAWVNGNERLLWLTQKVTWHVEGLEGLTPQGWYLVMPNHRSWLDIFVLQKIFNGKIPFLKFFLKKQLIWVPFLGPAWWALDFPFMHRTSKEELKKKPHLQGKDLETTRKACEKFKRIPVSVINFVEGTRFTPERHARQKSPYKHLLLPRAGGISFTLQAMGSYFTYILDVTILYQRAQVTLWDLFCGRISDIFVKVKKLPVPQELCQSGLLSEKEYQEKARVWLNQLWTQKDTLIEEWLPAVRPAGAHFS